MKQTDFEYNGRYLSDYGFVVCDFDTVSGISEISAGSTITFEKVSRNSGKKFELVHTKYTECMTSTFDICKNPDIYDEANMVITLDEFRDIVRWLNRRSFNLFHFVSDDGGVDEIETSYHNASFNISKLMLGERLCGIRLNLETDRPFGFGEERVYAWSTDAKNEQHVIADISDEIGFTYPNVTIRCKTSCNLILSNAETGCSSVIKNCSPGEMITMSGETNIIMSSMNGHDICNDFNFDFFTISNDIDRIQNTITVSHPCDIEIRYRPIIKFTYL